ncbi:hypothetical protein niasHS_008708 [Heterodera schachtii]|uniref:Uncharacterized protein n=1 Tax=Heterodera schachtii TaxID=97005 RepID=A0ABD2IV21_HETSC
MPDFQTFLANGLVAATMPLFFASQMYGKHLKVAKSKELFWNVPTLITAAAVLHNIAIDRNLPDFIDETFVDNQPSLLQINSLPTIRSLDSFNLRNNIAENFFGGSS